jgi:uncharacterized protein (TIGR03083 family)
MMAGSREELRASIVAAYQDLQSALDSMNPEDMLRLSPNEGWTAKDTLAHLCTIEVRQRGQVKTVLGGGTFPADPVDEYNDRMVSERRDRTIEELRAELEREHTSTLALLDSLSDADLEREFDHPRRGHIKLEGIWETIPRHTRTHAADIAATKANAGS